MKITMDGQSFYNHFLTVLKKDMRFLDEDGDIIRNAIIDKAFKYDEELLTSLLEDEKLKKVFFRKIKGSLVFLQSTFIDYIQDKNFLIDSYTKYKNKIGLTIDGKYLKERGEVALVWPFKDCVLEGGQTKEEQKRKEIFFNEVLAKDEIDRLEEPKILTNFKRYTKDGEEEITEIKRDKDGTIKDNLIIKGNNLLTLHSLKRQFTRKVDFIYIDPPYNTGGQGDTFAYNNSFKRSSWLTFIKNRIEIAKTLLTNDGIICVTIDDWELPRLWIILEEIFGEENHLGTVVIRNNPKGRMTTRKISLVHEYGLFFGRSNKSYIKKLPEKIEDKSHNYIQDENGDYYLPVNLRKQGVDSSATNKKGKLSDRYYPIYYDPKTGEISTTVKLSVELYPIDPNNEKRIWRRSKDVIDEMYKEKELIVKETRNGTQLYFKFRGGLDGKLAQSIWYEPEFSASEYGTKTVDTLLGERELFSYPKAPEAVKRSILAATDKKNAIILDFFAGSGTTAQAVFELNEKDGGNRKFILCEQLDYAETITVKRVKSLLEKEKLNDSFLFIELKKYNEEFIDRIQNSKTPKELLVIWEDMKDKSFLNYQVDIKKHEEAIEEFKALSLDKQKKALIELLDKNMLYVPLSDIEDEDFSVSLEDKALNKQFYG